MASQFDANAYAEWIKAIVGVASAYQGNATFHPTYDSVTREPPPDKYVDCTVIEKGDEDESSESVGT